MSENKPLAPILKQMNVGNKELYPANRRTSVATTRDRIQIEYPSRKYIINKHDDYFIQITRIK